MRADIKRLFIWMTVFFMAMAFLESAVVGYLRALYYPEGFDFPLVPMDPVLVNTEVLRELATLVMLLVPGALVTRSALERFAWFCYGFGVWDIFYYVWLKVLLDWPSSLGTNDLLFLVPVPWVGPVWAPCVISLGLIALAVIILRGRSDHAVGLVDRWSWSLLVAGAALMVISFTVDPFVRSFGVEALSEAGTLAKTRSNVLPHAEDYVPRSYPWPWFAVGCSLALAGLSRVYRNGCPLPLGSRSEPVLVDNV
jgi:hypothetical protein